MAQAPTARKIVALRPPCCEGSRSQPALPVPPIKRYPEQGFICSHIYIYIDDFSFTNDVEYGNFQSSSHFLKIFGISIFYLFQDDNVYIYSHIYIS